MVNVVHLDTAESGPPKKLRFSHSRARSAAMAAISPSWAGLTLTGIMSLPAIEVVAFRFGRSCAVQARAGERQGLGTPARTVGDRQRRLVGEHIGRGKQSLGRVSAATRRDTAGNVSAAVNGTGGAGRDEAGSVTAIPVLG